MLGSSWGGTAALGMYYANTIYMLWLFAACQNYCKQLLPSYSNKINMAQTSYSYCNFLRLKCSCAISGRSEMLKEEAAFLQVSYLHFRCDPNTQENSRNRKGNAEHLLDEILQGTNKWGFSKCQAFFFRSSNKAIT